MKKYDFYKVAITCKNCFDEWIEFVGESFAKANEAYENEKRALSSGYTVELRGYKRSDVEHDQNGSPIWATAIGYGIIRSATRG